MISKEEANFVSSFLAFKTSIQKFDILKKTFKKLVEVFNNI